MNDYFKELGDFASIGTLLAVLLQWLPVMASVLTIVWLGYRVLEAHNTFMISRSKRKREENASKEGGQ